MLALCLSKASKLIILERQRGIPTHSSRMLPKNAFTESCPFTGSNTFYDSNTFTKSNKYAESNTFTEISIFTESLAFTFSKVFTLGWYNFRQHFGKVNG